MLADYERCLRNHFSKKKKEKNGFRNGWLYPVRIVCNTYNIHIYMHVMNSATCSHSRKHKHTHLSLYPLLSFIHPFILTLINLLGIWLRMLPLGQVKAEYTFFLENKLEENALTFASRPLPFSHTLVTVIFFFLSSVLWYTSFHWSSSVFVCVHADNMPTHDLINV